mgnify:CR=1 FL=1
MSFKDMLTSDVLGVFLNDGEFADKHTIVYNGETYDGLEHDGIPVLYIKVKELEKPIQNAEGIFGVQAKLHIALSDIGGKIPEQGQIISIDDGEALGKKFFVRYKIATSTCSSGMVSLELEAYDE